MSTPKTPANASAIANAAVRTRAKTPKKATVGAKNQKKAVAEAKKTPQKKTTVAAEATKAQQKKTAVAAVATKKGARGSVRSTTDRSSTATPRALNRLHAQLTEALARANRRSRVHLADQRLFVPNSGVEITPLTIEQVLGAYECAASAPHGFTFIHEEQVIAGVLRRKKDVIFRIRRSSLWPAILRRTGDPSVVLGKWADAEDAIRGSLADADLLVRKLGTQIRRDIVGRPDASYDGVPATWDGYILPDRAAVTRATTFEFWRDRIPGEQNNLIQPRPIRRDHVFVRARWNSPNVWQWFDSLSEAYGYVRHVYFLDKCRQIAGESVSPRVDFDRGDDDLNSLTVDGTLRLAQADEIVEGTGKLVDAVAWMVQWFSLLHGDVDCEIYGSLADAAEALGRTDQTWARAIGAPDESEANEALWRAFAIDPDAPTSS